MTGGHPSDDDAAMAAEYALRLLGPDELAEVERRLATDPQFAEEVARWRGRLAPLGEEVDAVTPPAGLWRKIEAAVGPRVVANDNVVELKRRLNRWRAIGGGMTAIAASLAALLFFQPKATVPPPAAPHAETAPMVAMLGDQSAMKVVASWDPGARQLVLAVAGDMPADPAHAHELWVIPADGKPRSLGTMPNRKEMHMRPADALATLLQQGSTIAISVEPAGGSKTGAPTGPVIASGALRTT